MKKGQCEGYLFNFLNDKALFSTYPNMKSEREILFELAGARRRRAISSRTIRSERIKMENKEKQKINSEMRAAAAAAALFFFVVSLVDGPCTHAICDGCCVCLFLD
jgi:hypothetical protein